MRRAFAAGLFAALGLALGPVAHAGPEPGLTAFASAAELNALLDAQEPQEAGSPDECPPDKTCPRDGDLNEVIVTGSGISVTPSITNNQMAGVDEGDIVKARGETLIILRRGRLFTVSTAGGRLRAVDRIDAYPPGVDASDDWYDEMLVSGDWVVVVGFSYDRGGTEINRFRLDAAGRLTFVDSHRLSSDDYFSERNYASRLVGERLVFYMPVELDGADPLEKMPTLRRWPAEEAESGDDEAGEVRIVRAEDVHRAPGLEGEGAPRPEVIHVTVGCDLTAPELTCRATAILGPNSRNFYVTPTAVYV